LDTFFWLAVFRVILKAKTYFRKLYDRKSCILLFCVKMLLKIYLYHCCLLSMICCSAYVQQLICPMNSICFIYIILVRLTRSSTDIISSFNINYNHNVYIFVIFSTMNIKCSNLCWGSSIIRF
jgi:hypothetical protein